MIPENEKKTEEILKNFLESYFLFFSSCSSWRLQKKLTNSFFFFHSRFLWKALDFQDLFLIGLNKIKTLTPGFLVGKEKKTYGHEYGEQNEKRQENNLLVQRQTF